MPALIADAQMTGAVAREIQREVKIIYLISRTAVQRFRQYPKAGYARTWASQTAPVAAGIAGGATVISAKDNAESPLRIYGPGTNLADHRLLEVTSAGELILAGGAGNGYRLAELMGATNPSGWSGVLKVKTPAGATAGYILLYSNP